MLISFFSLTFIKTIYFYYKNLDKFKPGYNVKSSYLFDNHIYIAVNSYFSCFINFIFFYIKRIKFYLKTIKMKTKDSKSMLLIE